MENELKREYIRILERQASVAKMSLEVQTIESAGQGIAIPDIYIILDRMSCWIESKEIIRSERAVVTYKIGQLPRLRRIHYNHGVMTATLGIRDDMRYVLSWPDKALLATPCLRHDLYCNKHWVNGTPDTVLANLHALLKAYYKKD